MRAHQIAERLHLDLDVLDVALELHVVARLALLLGEDVRFGQELARLRPHQLGQGLGRGAQVREAAAEKAAEGDLERRARIMADDVVPTMAAVREVSDRVEEWVSDEFWTLPKYREMLLLV